MDGATTPGPWGWRGSPKNGGIYLVSLTDGRPTVMQFARSGMRGAQPMFRQGMFMEKATTFAVPEVSYRDNIVGLDHPDARLMETAPGLLAFAERFRRWHTGELGFCNCTFCKEVVPLLAAVSGEVLR